MKTISFVVCGHKFEITLPETGGGSISIIPSLPSEYSDSIESLVLSLACEGIKVDSPEFIRGLETALESLENKVG